MVQHQTQALLKYRDFTCAEGGTHLHPFLGRMHAPLLPHQGVWAVVAAHATKSVLKYAKKDGDNSRTNYASWHGRRGAPEQEFHP